MKRRHAIRRRSRQRLRAPERTNSKRGQGPALLASPPLSMAASGPTSPGLVVLICLEHCFDSRDLAVAELPGLRVEYFVRPSRRGHHLVGFAVGHGDILDGAASAE